MSLDLEKQLTFVSRPPENPADTTEPMQRHFRFHVAQRLEAD